MVQEPFYDDAAAAGQAQTDTLDTATPHVCTRDD